MTNTNRVMKLVWHVAPPPTGRYRSFEARGWPSADYKGPGKKLAVMLLCADDYVPARAREGRHEPIYIRITAWYDRPGQTQSFTWRRLTKAAATLDEAKAIAQRFLEAKPEYWPNEF